MATTGATRRPRLIRAFLAVVLGLAAWLLVARPGFATSTKAVPGQGDVAIVGDTVPAGQVVDNDALASGTDVVIDGTINGDLVAVGSTVTVNGPVAGSLVVVGGEITVNGEVGGSVYVLGRTLKVGATSHVEHNLHFAGLLLDSQRGSRIGRDLVAATVRGRVSSEIGRTLNAVILLLTFDGRIGAGAGGGDGVGGGVGSGLEGPGEGTTPGNTLLFIRAGGPRSAGLASGTALNLGLAVPNLASLASGLIAAQDTGSPGASIPDWLVARLGDLGALLLVGGLALWLRPSLVHVPAQALAGKTLPAAGFGLVALALTFSAGAIVLLFIALLFVVGVWLGQVTLWGLTFLLWGIGYPILILAVSVFVLAIAYGSKVVVADAVGTLIVKRFAPSVLSYRIVPLLLGLILYIVVRSIPWLGWAIEVVVTLFGLGAMWLALRGRPSPAHEVPVVVEPEAVAAPAGDLAGAA